MENKFDDNSYVDLKTAEYYRSNAVRLVSEYAKAETLFDVLIKNHTSGHSSILDIGCGSGRDLSQLKKAGHSVAGAEPSVEMIKKAEEMYPELKDTIVNSSLPNLTGIEAGFDLVLCSAVFQHIDSKYLHECFCRIDELLNSEGLFILSFPIQYPGVDPKSDRDSAGRYFKIRPESQYSFLLERHGLKLIETVYQNDSLSREGIRWAVQVFRKGASLNPFPLKILDSILRKDSKNTTYKFALLRSLANLASYSYRIAEWDCFNNVHIDINYLIDKWIEYYWPILTYSKYISQGQNKDENVNDIRFRNELVSLAEDFNGYHGLQHFCKLRDCGGLSADSLVKYELTKRAVKTAIIQGPVRYAGNKNTGRVFNQSGDFIVFSADLWKEFALMGKWIEDSIILRWAEFTTELRFNKARKIQVSEVMTNLLYSVDVKRDVGIVASLLGNLSAPVECVWTGTDLRTYDIDHALPFSIWKNNDMWNLFPAARTVNSHKSNKVPSRKLINKSRKRILNYWDLYFEDTPELFLHQASAFCGRSFYDMSSELRDSLLLGFNETADLAIRQHGAEEWSL